jgi:Holliday junction resolvasome RuvABC ATP-dependent DNA helicase subunit
MEVLTSKLAKKYVEVAKYLPDGLMHSQIRILEFLAKKGKHERTRKWNSIGELAICDNIGVDKDNFRKNLEPRLISRGLMERSSRGRCLTDKGHDYLISVKG